MRIKHQFTLLLAAIYIASMAGLAFNLHYCGGKLAEVSLYKPAKPCKMCAKAAETEEKHGCCETAIVDVKVKDDHQAFLKVFASKPLLEVILPDWAIFTPADGLDHHPKVAYLSHAPPTASPGPFNILNCIFRI